jgi:Tol biopolymer transport system component
VSSLGIVGVAASIVLVAAQAMASTASTASATPGVVFERGGDLYAVAVDGSRTVRLTSTPVWSEVRPAVSPDGQWIAYSRRWNFGTTTLWVMSLDGKQKRRLTRGDDFGSAWAPDGRHLYFARFFGMGGEWCGAIFRKRVDGREAARRVTRPPRFQQHAEPSVSPDGRKIAYTYANQCSGGTTVFAVEVADRFGRTTGDLAHLPGNRHHDLEPYWEAPAWSPDGRRLALIGDYAALHVANVDGTGLTRLTPKGFSDYEQPAWSSDGEWLAFIGGGRRRDVYLIRPDGTGLRRLTRTRTANEHSPSWLPRMPAG